MKVKSYAVLQRAIEEGYRIGWNRAHKHTEAPSDEHIEDQVLSAIMSEICDFFNFEEAE